MMNSILFLFMLMVIAHIIDDYYLQGILASLKQKEFWEKNHPDRLYKNDYKIALLMHGLSWSFMILVPIIIADWGSYKIFYFITWIVNGVFHAFIDNLKANKHRLNLIEDQCIHTMQIIITLLVYALFFI